MIVYKYSQLSDNNILSYAKSMEICKNARDLHFGQLKLFFSELIFLSIHAKPGYLVLYIGAAEGYHISLLADFFPECMFELWDPVPFKLEPRANIKLFNSKFTDTDAADYAKITDRPILLMCDLRNLEIIVHRRNNSMSGMDELVVTDMDMQASWAKTINPVSAYLKFRLPYNAKQTKYLAGRIYLQPYSKISTEARLMTSKYDKYIVYDPIKFDMQLAYHNAYNRCSKIDDTKWNNQLKKYNLYHCWDTIYAFYILAYYLKKIKGIKSKAVTGKVFMKIVAFHIKQTGPKYRRMFNDNKIPDDIDQY